jgi:hypothetical protein
MDMPHPSIAWGRDKLKIQLFKHESFVGGKICQKEPWKRLNSRERSLER